MAIAEGMEIDLCRFEMKMAEDYHLPVELLIPSNQSNFLIAGKLKEGVLPPLSIAPFESSAKDVRMAECRRNRHEIAINHQHPLQ